MSNDSKNRLGDKLAAKEKAEEDIFFAKSDRAKLEAIKQSNEMEKTPAAGSPGDGQPLVEQQSDELEQIAERGDGNWLAKWFRSIFGV